MSIRLHTPGPWTVDYTDDNLRIYAGDLLIAEVNGSTEHIEVRSLDQETTEANAWLIATAPDLLAALERITARVETLNLFTERGQAKVVEQARAAISKATGRCNA
jgi:hypothetical protein